MAVSQRPIGVTILSVLAIISGILGGFAALGVVAGLSSTGEVGVSGAGVATILGVGILALSVLNLIFGFGALALKPWAWGLGIGLQLLAIIAALAQLLTSASGSMPGTIVGLVINGLVLYYLFSPTVKRAFGRA